MNILAIFFHPIKHGTDSIGGVERRFIEVSKAMHRTGISIRAIEFFPSLQRAFRAGYVSCEINRLFPRSFPERVVSVFQALRLGVSLNKVRKVQIVVVVGHRYLTFTIVCAFLLARRLHVPVAIVSGGLLPREMMSLRELIMERRKEGFTLLGTVVRTAADWLTRQLYRRTAAFIVVSQSEKEDVVRFLHMHPARVHVVGNGIDLELIDSIPRRKKVFHAAFLGRVEYAKGMKTLIDTWAKVVDRIPLAQLVVIGGGRLGHYKRLVELMNLSNNVRFAGSVPFGQALAFLKQSKIFLFPSKRESFPLSLLEAMACGLPCVVSEIPSLRENFRKGAIFIQPDRDEAFAETALDLLNHDNKREVIGAQAREYAEMFSWENVADKEIRVLMEVL